MTRRSRMFDVLALTLLTNELINLRKLRDNGPAFDPRNLATRPPSVSRIIVLSFVELSSNLPRGLAPVPPAEPDD